MRDACTFHIYIICGLNKQPILSIWYIWRYGPNFPSDVKPLVVAYGKERKRNPVPYKTYSTSIAYFISFPIKKNDQSFTSRVIRMHKKGASLQYNASYVWQRYIIFSYSERLYSNFPFEIGSFCKRYRVVEQKSKKNNRKSKRENRISFLAL